LSEFFNLTPAGRQHGEGAEALTTEAQQEGLWRNCEDSIRHALQHFSEGANEEDDFHHRKWAVLSVAHAAEAYGNLLLCTFDQYHPPKGRYFGLKRLRDELNTHERLSPLERDVFDLVLKDLSDQRNSLMHEPAPEKPAVADAAVCLLSLLYLIRRRTGLETKEFFDQIPPVERDVLDRIPWRDHQRWFELAERLARAEYGEALEGCDNCGTFAVPPRERCQACFIRGTDP
jgi:hypothetical protein